MSGLPPEGDGLTSADRFMQATENFANLAATLAGFRAQLMGHGFGPEAADRIVVAHMEQAFMEQRHDWAREAAGSDPHLLARIVERWMR